MDVRGKPAARWIASCAPSRLVASLAGLVVWLALVGGGGAAAQDEPGGQARGAGGVVLDSPRAVMTEFLRAMRAHDEARAATTFDPGFAGDPRDAATKLQDTLDRTVFIDLEELPAAGDARLQGGRWPFEASPPEHPQIRVRIRFRQTDAGWVIAAGTLERVDAMWASVASLPPLEELLSSLSTLDRWHYLLRERLHESLLQRAFLLENWQWLGLLLCVFLGVVVDRIVRWVARRASVRLTRAENVRLAPEVLLGFERPVGLLAGVLAFELALPVLGLEVGMLGVLRLATGFVATVAGVWAAYRLVDVLCDYLAERAAKSDNKFDDMLVPLLRRTFKLFVVVVAIVFVASRLSEDLWGIVAGLGIGSLALGFAARDSIENLFGTFTVLLDKPFQIGHWILVGDLEGTVEQVGFRSTRLRTFYNSLITVPNRTFIASPVDNMGERRYRRIKTTLALTYDTPPEKIEAFCEGVRQIVRSHPYTRKDYYHVYLNGFGASSLDVLLYCFVETPDWSTELREKHRLFADVLRLAERLGVSFAFPTQTIHVARPEDLEHPDRPASDRAGGELGRRTADEIVERTLDPYGGIGHKPAAVKIETEPVRSDRTGD